MKRARFSEEQIIGILKAAEAVGNIRAACRENNISEQTFYRWRRKFGGMDVSDHKKRKHRTTGTSAHPNIGVPVIRRTDRVAGTQQHP